MAEFTSFIKSHVIWSIIFIIYKYLKYNYKHVNLFETIRYFQWELSSIYNMKKKSSLYALRNLLLKFLLSLPDEKSL